MFNFEFYSMPLTYLQAMRRSLTNGGHITDLPAGDEKVTDGWRVTSLTYLQVMERTLTFSVTHH